MEEKKNLKISLFSITAVAISAVLYDKQLGVNVVLVWVFLCAMLITFRFNFIKSNLERYLISSLMLAMSVFTYLWHHLSLNLVAVLVFFLIWLAANFVKQRSALLELINSFYSIFAAPFILLFERLSQLDEDKLITRPNYSGRLTTLRISTAVIPILGGVLFLMLYANSNKSFSVIFEYFSFNYILFLISTTFFLCGVMYYKQLKTLNKSFDRQGESIIRIRKNSQQFHPLALKFELKTGINLLLVLNSLLLLFIISDLVELTSFEISSEISSKSEEVHYGVYTLIFSIVLAISIILYFFRSSLNFFKANKFLKRLSYTWIVLNATLIILILYKNSIYVDSFGLTYKRIGVFVYLLLSFIGLVTTFIKVKAIKNSWFLLNCNLRIASYLLLLASFFSWDTLITEYNLKRDGDVDMNYLIGLSDNNLPQLMEYSQDHYISDDDHRKLKLKVDRFRKQQLDKSLLSWNYSDYSINKWLKNYNK